MLKNFKIKTRIILLVVTTIILLLAGVGVFTYKMSANTVLKELEKTLLTLAEQGSNQVILALENRKKVLEAIANRSVIKSGQWDEQESVLLQEIERTDFIGMGIVSLSGSTKYPQGKTAQLGDRDYVKKALQGNTNVSNVIISRVTNTAVMMVATPIRNEQNQITSVLIGRLSGDILTDITDQLKYGELGYSYIIDGKGSLIAHKDRKLVLNQVNYIEKSNSDKALLSLASVMKNMIKGLHSFEHYKYKGSIRFMGYAPIKGTNWSIAIGSFEKEILASVKKMRLLFLGIFAGAILIGFIVSSGIAISITKPLALINQGLADISSGEGDLTKRLDYDASDELGELSNNFNLFVEKIHKIIYDLVQDSNDLFKSAEELSAFSTQLASTAQEMSYQVDTVATTSTEINNNTMEIANESEQAAEGVNTVAAAAVEMSANVNTVAAAAEQASVNISSVVQEVKDVGRDIQEIITKITGISDNAHTSASAIEEMSVSLQEVAKNTSNAGTISNNANTQAHETAKIMENLKFNVNEIGSVVNLINDISDQTNMLALNATIEAASAGDAGKGFAVVANEVKELAKQTAEATSKIQSKIEEMQDATNKTVTSIEAVGVIIEELNVINTGIAASVEEQSATVEEIARAISYSAENSTEVATFAQQIGVATENINRNVEEAGNGIIEIARNATETSSAANIVAKNSEEVSSGVSNIAKNTVDITKGVGDISQNLSDVSLASQETAQGAESLKNSSSKLDLLAQRIKSLVDQFKV